MNNKLPPVFANNIKSIKNNDLVSYNNHERSEDIDIDRKIDMIFKSPNYIYKIDVEIRTMKDNLRKTIIGKSLTNLITIDNELIPISDILDIKAF